MKPLTIDTSEFTRRGDVAGGERAVTAMPRLASLLHDDAGSVAWQLGGRIGGSADGRREPQLSLALDGKVAMRCVRCLEPVDVPFSVRRDFRLVGSEEQAEREDLEDEQFDLLVASRRFDVAELIEDEAILALPLAPRHDDCRPPTGADEPAEPLPQQRPNPFAVLRRLRGADDGSD
jgi:uncharacterized protein